jgi:trans-aconitate methyltransferase
MKDLWNPALYKSNHSFVYNYGKNLLELLDPKDGEEILDLGCGTGELTYEIFKKTSKVTGIDASEKMLISARENYPGIDFLNINALEMEYHEKFDKVFSNAVFHWIFEQEKFLKKIYDSLKPGGKLVFEMGGKDNAFIILDNIRKAMIRRGFYNNAEKQITFFPSVAEYSTLLEKSGFTVRYALYFDRDTELSGNDGMKNFINMFYSAHFSGISTKMKDEIIEEVESSVKHLLFRDGKWYADYKRLRMAAEKII